MKMKSIRELGDSQGFTMIELTISMAIFTILSGIMYSVVLAAGEATNVQESRIILRDDARIGLSLMTRSLRMARKGGYVISPEGNSITFRRVTSDQTGNFFPVDAEYNLVFDPPVTYALDINDSNKDNRTVTQLVQFDDQGQFVRAIANYINPTREPIFTRVNGGGIRIILNLSRQWSVMRPPMSARLEAIVVPRN